MTYPFVQAANDYGPRKGPTLAFVIHMAEGGGTVGFLSRPNIRGVSVHYVIEYSGRIVQMLHETRASGSINPNMLRTTDGPPPYGASVAKAVLGGWWKDPNSAVITVEIEGFAGAGPNTEQQVALRSLVDDVRSRYPDIGLLGHRDFAGYKACPGAHIPWDDLGGHGPATTDTAAGDDVRFINSDGYAVASGKLLPVKAGSAWQTFDGKPGGTFSADTKVPVVGRVDAHVGQYAVLINTGDSDIYPDNVTRPALVLVPSTAALLDAPPAGPITPASSTVLVPGLYEVKP